MQTSYAARPIPRSAPPGDGLDACGKSLAVPPGVPVVFSLNGLAKGSLMGSAALATGGMGGPAASDIPPGVGIPADCMCGVLLLPTIPLPDDCVWWNWFDALPRPYSVPRYFGSISSSKKRDRILKNVEAVRRLSDPA